MACSQAVCSAVKANIESGLAVVDEVNDLIVGDLGHQTASLQFFVKGHGIISSCFIGQRTKENAPCQK